MPAPTDQVPYFGRLKETVKIDLITVPKAWVKVLKYETGDTRQKIVEETMKPTISADKEGGTKSEIAFRADLSQIAQLKNRVVGWNLDSMFSLDKLKDLDQKDIDHLDGEIKNLDKESGKKVEP